MPTIYYGGTVVGATGTILTSVNSNSAPTFQAPAASSITIAGNSGSTTGNSFTFTGGTSGEVFTMAAGTMTASFNFLALPTTTSANGQILINSVPVFHAYGTDNVFIGTPAATSGNFTLTTASAYRNTAIGSGVLPLLTTGSHNIGVGYHALAAATTASSNVAVGDQSLYQLTTAGNFNTALGTLTLQNLGTGSANIAIGNTAGQHYTTSESSNIVLGADGTVGESNVMRLGTTGAGVGEVNKAFIAGVTGVTPGTAGALVTVTDSAGQVGTLGAGTNGQVLLGSTGANPVFATLTSSGSTITFTPGAGTLNLEAASGGMTWAVKTSTPIALVKNNGYGANSGTIVFTLPTTAAVGDTFSIIGMDGGTGWQVTQSNSPSQQIFFGNQKTTAGNTGSIASTNKYDCVTLVCLVANTTFYVETSIGNITVV